MCLLREFFSRFAPLRINNQIFKALSVGVRSVIGNRNADQVIQVDSRKEASKAAPVFEAAETNCENSVNEWAVDANMTRQSSLMSAFMALSQAIMIVCTR